jgi:hypothetical protein
LGSLTVMARRLKDDKGEWGVFFVLYGNYFSHLRSI